MDSNIPWLVDGNIKISADEQIRFLEAFYLEELIFSEYTTNIVKDMILMEETDTYRFSGKTGGCNLEDRQEIGWFMGYVETEDNVFFFVTNMNQMGDIRIDLTRQILSEFGIIPQ
jgi:beta-lactamase class D